MEDQDQVEQYIHTSWKTAIFFAMLLNFMTFVGISFYMGGSSLSGKAENGLYYVGDHGSFTEVTYGEYIHSYVHGIVSMLSVIIFLLLAAFFDLKAKLRKEKGWLNSVNVHLNKHQWFLVYGFSSFWMISLIIIRI